VLGGNKKGQKSEETLLSCEVILSGLSPAITRACDEPFTSALLKPPLSRGLCYPVRIFLQPDIRIIEEYPSGQIIRLHLLLGIK
jgi:hypothetical protein